MDIAESPHVTSEERRLRILLLVKPKIKMKDLRHRNVFVDEYGTPSLEVEKSGVTNHYIIAAVLIDPELQRDAEEEIRKIASMHFSGGEIKSKSVGKDDERRIRILAELAAIPFHLHILSVDKRSLFPSGGLVYKKPFMKYMHGRLYRKLFAAHPRIALVIDEHGSKTFMRGFEKYISEVHVQADLFSEVSVRFADSMTEPALQLADFCAGSFARVFDTKKLSSSASDILSILRPKVLTAEHWPPRIRGFLDPVDDDDSADSKVSSRSRRSALTYLENNYEATDKEIVMRVEVLRHLLFRLDHDQPGSYVPTHEILSALRETAGIDVTDTYFRTNVIGPLRDEGVLIVSGPQGYKVADRTADVRNFALEVERRVVPQLRRLGLMHDAIRSTTSGEIDILDGDMEYLAHAIDIIRRVA